MAPRTERNRRRDQTARLPGRWRHLGPRIERATRKPDDNDVDASDAPTTRKETP